MLQKVAAALEDNRPIMGLIGEIVHDSIISNFEEGGRPVKWPELSATTIAQRKKIKKWPGKILIRRGGGGGLMGSIDYRPQKDKVAFEAKEKYADAMQYGAEAGSFGTFKVVVRAHERGVKGRPGGPGPGPRAPAEVALGQYRGAAVHVGSGRGLDRNQTPGWRIYRGGSAMKLEG